jgi:putative membrane protein
MKNRPWIVVLFSALVLAALACHHETTDNNTTTDTYATSTSATDTSATTSTLATSGTETSGTTDTTSTTGSASTPVDPADSEFMSKAAQGGMAEVSLGQLASSKATDPGVKAFGDRMVTDHTRLGDELKQLAQTKGVTLPTDVDDEAKKTSDKLSKLTGKAFDKEYISDMVKDHEKDVKEFEKQSKGAKDADLKTWVTNSLPTLQDHLKMAKETKSKLK